MNTSVNITDLAAVVAGLMIVGKILKSAFPKFPNRFIPAVTWVCGVLSYQITAGNWSDPKQWLVAIIASATATGTHSAIKNTVNAKAEEKTQ